MEKEQANGREIRGVAVGLSGGIDSAVAAMLLRDQGHRVVGVFLQLWTDPRRPTSEPRGADPAHQAAAVAEKLGVDHVVVDGSELFASSVTDYFINDYARGRTPNPCVKCNARVKLPLLADTAHRLGLSHIATGHYARRVGDLPLLARGAGLDKDQSYVLAEVPPSILRQLVLPLGEITKEQVRLAAARGGLTDCVSPRESQEICFVPDNDYRAFLRGRLGVRPGEILDQEGRPLGLHGGTYGFTIGQRKGLGIAAREPLYVVAIDGERQTVTVAPASAGLVRTLTLTDVVVHEMPQAEQGLVQVRSCGAPVPARMLASDRIELCSPATGVAPGQTAVYYEGATVLFAGTIASTSP